MLNAFTQFDAPRAARQTAPYMRRNPRAGRPAGFRNASARQRLALRDKLAWQ
jgi:hypothetical protein